MANIQLGDIQLLSRESLRQLDELGYSEMTEDPIIKALEKVDVRLPDTKRRQFSISKNISFTQEILGPGETICYFMPRKVLYNRPTDNPDEKYIPSRPVQFIRNLEKKLVHQKQSGFSSKVACRELAKIPEINALMRRAYKNGNLYSLMGTIRNTSREIEIPGIKKDTSEEIHIRQPILIIPGLTTEEICEVGEICKKYQIPSEEKLRSHIYTGEAIR